MTDYTSNNNNTRDSFVADVVLIYALHQLVQLDDNVVTSLRVLDIRSILWVRKWIKRNSGIRRLNEVPRSRLFVLIRLLDDVRPARLSHKWQTKRCTDSKYSFVTYSSFQPLHSSRYSRSASSPPWISPYPSHQTEMNRADKTELVCVGFCKLCDDCMLYVYGGKCGRGDPNCAKQARNTQETTRQQCTFQCDGSDPECYTEKRNCVDVCHYGIGDGQVM